MIDNRLLELAEVELNRELEDNGITAEAEVYRGRLEMVLDGSGKRIEISKDEIINLAMNAVERLKEELEELALANSLKSKS